MSFPPAPYAPPSFVSVSDITSTSIAVQWGPVDCIDHNGEITGYLVRYGVIRTGNTQVFNVSGGVITETAIFGLKASTIYFIEVAAMNRAGSKVFSNSTSVRTSGMVYSIY